MEAKALFMVEPGQIEIRTVDVKDPGPTEVQVRIEFCGICAWDQYLFKGVSLTESFPFTFGHEGVGVIEKVGSLVNNLEPGQRVMVASGGSLMAEYANVPGHCATPVLKELERPELWVGEPIVCVMNSMTMFPIMPGDRAVLIGAGYMGNLVIQGLQKMPLSNLTVLELLPERVELARDFGADEVWQVGTPEGDARIEALASGSERIDVIIDCSGSESGFALANRFIQDHSRFNMFGWHRGNRSFDGTPWHLQGLTIYNTAPNINPHFNDLIPRTAAMMAAGVFDQSRLVTHTAHFNDAQPLFEKAIAKEDGYIKGVIDFS